MFTVLTSEVERLTCSRSVLIGWMLLLKRLEQISSKRALWTKSMYVNKKKHIYWSEWQLCRTSLFTLIRCTQNPFHRTASPQSSWSCPVWRGCVWLHQHCSSVSSLLWDYCWHLAYTTWRHMHENQPLQPPCPPPPRHTGSKRTYFLNSAARCCARACVKLSPPMLWSVRVARTRYIPLFTSRAVTLSDVPPSL